MRAVAAFCLGLSLLAGCAASPERRDTRSSGAIRAAAEAAIDAKNYAAALPGLEELARRGNQWGAFMLGNYYSCGKVVRFDCSKAQELFLVSEKPKDGEPVDAELVNRSRNEIAWINAACDQAGFVRNGALALRLALAMDVDPDDPLGIDTVAAAYAETANFQMAIRVQRHAIRSLQANAASASMLQANLEAFRRRLAAYESGKPARFDAAIAAQECNTLPD
jgi:uncharacterized protein